MCCCTAPHYLVASCAFSSYVIVLDFLSYYAYAIMNCCVVLMHLILIDWLIIVSCFMFYCARLSFYMLMLMRFFVSHMYWQVYCCSILHWMMNFLCLIACTWLEVYDFVHIMSYLVHHSVIILYYIASK